MSSQKEITNYLNGLGITTFELKEYHINTGLQVKTKYHIYIYQDVYIQDKWLHSIKHKIKEVQGDFIITNCKINTLVGFPNVVTGDFDCSYNKLKSIGHGPKKVGRSYICSHNQITKLNLLKKIPVIEGDFDCSYNQLKNLSGGPIEVKGSYNCSNNQLVSLTGAPHKHSGLFDCSGNIKTLKNISMVPDGCFLRY